MESTICRYRSSFVTSKKENHHTLLASSSTNFLSLRVKERSIVYLEGSGQSVQFEVILGVSFLDILFSHFISFLFEGINRILFEGSLALTNCFHSQLGWKAESHHNRDSKNSLLLPESDGDRRLKVDGRDRNMCQVAVLIIRAPTNSDHETNCKSQRGWLLFEAFCT